jgi:general secretion pathway protein E
VRVGEKVVDLRISSLPTGCGERVVLRLLDKSARLYHLSELGMADSDRKVFRNLICRTHGIMLVTGPTGSGKSTTLYAALMELNSEELNILTLEDPIEYQLPGISQTQVSNQKGMTFATGLRTVLRQDPDVIMVGEIRDEETARMAIQSSLTGHLVFSTLHTNDAAGAVARLLDLSVEPYLVAGSLLGVMAQRLVRRVCGKCRRTVGLSAEAVRLLRLAEDLRDHEVYEPAGCTACHQTGYCDRVGVFELLRVNEALRSLIVDRPTSDAVRTTARHAGMTTLREDAMRKLLAGITTVEDVLRVTHQEVDDSEPTPAD